MAVVESEVAKLESRADAIKKRVIHEKAMTFHSQALPKPNKVTQPYKSTFFSESKPLRTNKSSEVRHQQHLKEISAVDTNRDVVFGQEERFPDGKPSTEFKYKINRSFDFSSSIIDEESETMIYESRYSPDRKGKYYRGASIGRGYKTDFTKLREKCPGVGSYMLPTIWDRYK